MSPSTTTALVEHHLWHDAGRDRVVLPLVPPSDELRALDRLLRLLHARGLAGRCVRLRVSRLPPWWVATNALLLANAERVQVWRLRKGTVARLIERDLAQPAATPTP